VLFITKNFVYEELYVFLKTIRISSIAEYFSYSEEYNFRNYISRGESLKYDAITASAFRPYNMYGKFFGANHLTELYNHVGNELTAMQKEHFLAFAQHNGLPTYLIDFTTSPLISLFFSCYSDDMSDTQPGYIYMINKNSLYGMDDMIVKNDYSGKANNPWMLERWVNQREYFDYDHSSFLYKYQEMVHSLIDLILFPKPDFYQSDLYKSIHMLCKRLKDKRYIASDEQGYVLAFDDSSFDKINVDILSFIGQIEEQFATHVTTIEDVIWEKRLSPEESWPKDWNDYNSLSYWRRNKMFEEPRFDMVWESVIKDLFEFAVSFAHVTSRPNFYLPYYGTYSPPNISGRVLTQNSIFICQLHYAKIFRENEPSPINLLLTQQIKPDITIEVLNKKKILKELDEVGINLKTIFGDYDSISKYLKNNFYYDAIENNDMEQHC